MRVFIFCLILICLQFSNLQGQSTTQSLSGFVLDKDTQQPLIGAELLILDSNPTLGTTTDIDGSFLLENIPLGRHIIVCSYIGYESFQSDNISFTAARGIDLTIELTEAGVTTETVVVSALKHGSEALNELSVVSTRSFSVDETQRYAASGNDPGRMAMGFPGVQPTRDSRSDIVIRGNSSVGMSWRLNGVDIPNPNHFARRGSSGGGITIFSVSMLGKSDFSTGAFPAEYGNALSGIFDIKFRKGNTSEQEHTFRAGMLGLDIATEGPIKKGSSSYLVNYRYSTLGILNSLGLHLVGPRVRNTFQDLSFNIHLPSKNKNSIFSIWSIGGLSNEQELAEEELADRKSFNDYQTRDFRTNMGAIGLSHNYLINNRSYLKSNLAFSAQKIIYRLDTVNTEDQKFNFNNEEYLQSRVQLNTYYSNKLHTQLTLKSGLGISLLSYDLYYDRYNFDDETTNKYIEEKGSSFLIQPFLQLRYRPAEKLTLIGGFHAMYLTLNNSYSIEPRAALKFQMNEAQTISIAYGHHSKMVPIGSYFTRVNEVLPNQSLELIKTRHLVLAYDHIFKSKFRIHAEAYYQRLSDVPVSTDQNSSFWLLNDIDGFSEEALVSEGSGTNYGLDLSFEKFFRQGSFVLLAGSIFNSTYEGLDGSVYNTQYNSKYTATLMGGQEWNIGSSLIFQVSTKFLYNGGLPITPLLENNPTSNSREPQLDHTRPFSEQIDDYYRLDARLSLRKNKKNRSWTLALDLQNLTNHINIDGLNRSFDPDQNKWIYRTQSGLIPILSFQLDL